MGCEALVCNCQYVLRIPLVIAKSNVMVTCKGGFYLGMYIVTVFGRWVGAMMVCKRSTEYLLSTFYGGWVVLGTRYGRRRKLKVIRRRYPLR